MNQKIGFIGVGNMGGAILDGLIRLAQKNHATTEKIWVYDAVEEKAALFAQRYKINQVHSNKDLVSAAEVIVLAVKPQDLTKTVAEFSSVLTEKHIIISILAGTPVSKLRQTMGDKPKIVRAMPNLGATVGESITAITSTDAGALKVAREIFEACGKVIELDEKHFDLVTALSGSGPAYFFLLMELLVEEGKRHGLKEADAQLLAAQTALGAGKLIMQKSESPAVWRERVTSKGGTTEAALKVLSENKLAETVRKAVEAAYKRGRELGK
jgi:pyrroline-5-carboxylate reductase